MTTYLRDELARLAEEAPPSAPPGGLWERGIRRRHRRRVLAAGVATTAIVLGAAVAPVGLDVLRGPRPVPATPGSSAALPEQLYVADPRTPGTAEEGPLGRLAVILGAERHRGFWGRYENGTVGVSATTGEYRFLDLPDRVVEGDRWLNGAEPVLSPDGRHVAYWLRHPDEPTWVGGYAVYDTVSGEVVRREVPGERGVLSQELAWTGPDALVVQYAVVSMRGTSSMASRTQAPVMWWPDRHQTYPLESLGDREISAISPTRSGFGVFSGSRLSLANRHGSVSGPEGRSLPGAVRFVRGQVGHDRATLSPDARTVVLLPQSAALLSRRLLVGAVEVAGDQVGRGPDVRPRPLPVGLEMVDLLGWKDAEHVVVRGVRPGTAGTRASAYSVDVRTGEHEPVIDEHPGNWAPRADYADVLWARSPLPRPAPGDVLDPRVPAGGAAAALVLAVVALRRWRRAR